MIRSRVFPVLLLTGSGLIKTKQFKRYKYLGDVINTLKIFNELSVDELCIFGLDPNRDGKPIDFDFLKKISREANMPLCYGGGVSCVDDAKRLIDIGYEKISLNTVVYTDFEVVDNICNAIGRQSVVTTIDYKYNFLGKPIIYSHCGSKRQSIPLARCLTDLSSVGVSEVVLQNITKDGMRTGFDIDLLAKLNGSVRCHLSLVGGCAAREDIIEVDSLHGPVGVGVGSHFVFQGKLDAVLISYECV